MKRKTKKLRPGSLGLMAMAAALAFLAISCREIPVQDSELRVKKKEEAKKYKRVIDITHKVNSYVVTTSTQSGGNSIQRGAGGAIIGGGVDMLLGGSGGGGAIVGGLLGAATTKDPKVQSYTETRTDIIYTIVFDDGSVVIRNNYLPFAIGDSLEIY